MNVATLQTFVDFYTADGVTDLPPGEVPSEPLAIHADQQGSETISSVASIRSMLSISVKG